MRDAPELLERARELTGRRLRKVRLFTDTTDFIEPWSWATFWKWRGAASCSRAPNTRGASAWTSKPKYWVKRAVDWEDGSAKIIKLEFFEEFDISRGGIKVRCFRSPAKEARILAMVRGNPNFMQGVTLRDESGNLVRVLERIHGGPSGSTPPEVGMRPPGVF